MRNKIIITLTVCCILQIDNLAAFSQDVVGRRGVVVSGNLLASRIGLTVLRRGGNAIDAAVATGFALAVAEPRAGNIGGGGFMLIRMADGRTTTVDFREKAPLAASRAMYLDAGGNVIEGLSTQGIMAAAVPGTVRGYALALERFGTRPWAELVTPAAELAEGGFAVTWELHHDLAEKKTFLTRFAETRRVFYPRGDTPRLNALFRQPDLAATLQRIAELGPDEFYTGKTAALLVNHVQRQGGLITRQDLEEYTAVQRPPIIFDYRGHTVIGMGPPSSGGVVTAGILNQLELVNLPLMEYHSAAHLHAMIEADRRAFADRAHFLGDADFVEIPVAELISDDYAARRWQDFSESWATPSREVGVGVVGYGMESNETTHFSIIDRWGNAVAVTTTINGLYGCGEMVQGAGFLLNNEMDDFAIAEQVANKWELTGGQANAIGPGKRMLSSMSPTMVLRNDSLMLIMGSPGGSTIITTIAQIISNMVDFNMTLKQAVEAPRVHHQWQPDEVRIEAFGIGPETKRKLTRMGHKIVFTETSIGSAHCIYLDPRTGWYFGSADSRRESGAAAY